ncbi:cation:proton antiporter [Candidatus Woesearchaeota archaeon]|nr:cation:proton antiporter [Candidatus Woesearchaeota archaeon]
MVNIFLEIGIIIIAATLLAMLARFLKQPLIIAYIFAGVVIGPIGLGWIQSQEMISLFSELGIVFLLFIVGLQLDLRKLKNVGWQASIIGLAQVIFTAGIGFFIARVYFSDLISFYIAVALAFSSTVIVVKLLSDKNEINTLHGRISIGVLLIQDLVAILILIFVSSIDNLSTTLFLSGFYRILTLFTVALIAYVLIMPYIFRKIGQSRELLLITALAWAFGMTLLANYLQVSTAIAALLAGISLAGTPYSIEIVGRVKPLRDFFVTIFFVSLGMQVALAPLQKYFVPIVVFCVFVLLGNPFILYVVMKLLKYKPRTSFLVSVSMAQISEFSIVLVALGLSLGHLNQEIVSIIAVIATVTIGLSTYFIIYDDWLFRKFKFVFKVKSEEKLQYLPKKQYDVILAGYNRIGYSIFNKLKSMKKRVLVVDYNPEVVKSLIEEEKPCIYGDVGDLEVIDKMNLKHAKMLISTVPDIYDNLLMVKKLKEANPRALAILTANQIEEALRLYEKGADYVIMPHFLGGEHVSFLVEKYGKDLNKILRKKLEHIEELKRRQSIGHEHPRH